MEPTTRDDKDRMEQMEKSLRSVNERNGWGLSEKRLRTALAATWDGYASMAMQYPPYSPHRLIQTKQWDEMDAMMQLSAVRSPTNVKRYAVICKPWTIVPSLDNKDDPDYKLAEEIALAADYCLRNIDNQYGPQDFRQVLYEITSAFHYGFTLHEIIWKRIEGGRYDGTLGFSRIAMKRPRQVGFKIDQMTGQVQEITSYTPQHGLQFKLPPEKFHLFTYNPEILPHGYGDGLANYKHYVSIMQLIKVWNISLERFGGPFLMAKYPLGNEEMARQIATLLESISAGASAVFPEGVEVEAVQLNYSSNLNMFLDSIGWHAAQITQNILLQTLTTNQGTGVGAYALGSIHQETQEYAHTTARSDIEESIRINILRKFVLYNWGPDYLHLTPRLSLGHRVASDDLLIAQAMDTYLKNNVVHPSEEFIRQMAGFPPMDQETQRLIDEDKQREMDMKMKSGIGQTAGGAGK